MCRQDPAAVRVLSGRYIVQAQAQGGNNTDLIKAHHFVSRVQESGQLLLNDDSNFTAPEDFSVLPQHLALQECEMVAVDRYASVEACARVDVTLNGNEHYTTADVTPGYCYCSLFIDHY